MNLGKTKTLEKESGHKERALPVYEQFKVAGQYLLDLIGEPFWESITDETTKQLPMKKGAFDLALTEVKPWRGGNYGNKD